MRRAAASAWGALGTEAEVEVGKQGGRGRDAGLRSGPLSPRLALLSERALRPAADLPCPRPQSQAHAQSQPLRVGQSRLRRAGKRALLQAGLTGVQVGGSGEGPLSRMDADGGSGGNPSGWLASLLQRPVDHHGQQQAGVC